MKINTATAIVNEFRLKDVEEVFIRHDVSGVTLHPVSGRGQDVDSFTEKNLIKHIQMGIYAIADQVNDIAQLIMDVTHADSEGLVSIVPVNIHDQRAANQEGFYYHEVHYD